MDIERFRPRFGDLDGFNHVNNAKFLTYFEIGRVNIFRSMRKVLGDDQVTFILARMEIDYLAPIHLDAFLELRTWVNKIGNKSFELHYLLRDYEFDIVHAKGVSTQVRYDYTSKQSVPINDDLRNELSKFKQIST
jgi:acyl-CoA thioester hydrolase